MVLTGQTSLFDTEDTLSGRMSQACSVQTSKTDSETLELFWRKLSAWQNQDFLFLDCRANRNGQKPEQSSGMDGASHGEYTMHSSGEFRNGDGASASSLIMVDLPRVISSLNASEKPVHPIQTKLSQVLEPDADVGFWLSSEGLSGDSESSEQARQEAAGDTEHGSGVDDRVVVGFDSYNQASTGEVSKPLTSAATDSDHTPCVAFTQNSRDEVRDLGNASGCLSAEPGMKQQTYIAETVALEENGQRESHKGDGYKETDKMYTLNTTEVHGVAYGFKPRQGSAAQGIGWESETAPTLNTDAACSGGVVCVLNDQGGASINVENGETAPTLRAQSHQHEPVVCYGISSYDSNSMKSANPNSGIYEADTSRTLDLNGGSPACNQGGVAVCEPQPLCIEMTSTKNTVVDDGISPTLTARMGTGGNQVNAVCEKAVRWIVRRLTPKECERLQGYDLICGFDGWTDIGEWVDSKGKRHKEANSPRYKALGNSIALPFWHWMFGNMAKYIPEDATLGSLFDGIGGFPLCWESIHGKGTARWASEIEEFPIAVTKIRFPEEESGETATTDEPTRNESDSESVAYTQGQFANYREGVGTLRSSGGDLGGGQRL